MRLGTITDGDATVAVVLRDGLAVPVVGYADVGALLADGDRGLAAARVVTGRGTPLGDVELRRPVLAPGAVVCVGVNYRAHALEMGRELPGAPTLFAKLARTLADPGAEIVLRGTTRPDYEGELVAVIGPDGGVAGYTLMNDVSARDLQYRTSQWFAGKNLERSTPVGPWVVTADEIGPLAGRRLETRVDGELRQSAPLDDLIFDVPALVTDLGRLMTLRPGDLIATGTPGGVGHATEPPGYLRDGSLVEVAVDGIGILSNRFRIAAPAAP